jgi:hypothetical protein
MFGLPRLLATLGGFALLVLEPVLDNFAKVMQTFTAIPIYSSTCTGTRHFIQRNEETATWQIHEKFRFKND